MGELTSYTYEMKYEGFSHCIVKVGWGRGTFNEAFSPWHIYWRDHVSRRECYIQVIGRIKLNFTPSNYNSRKWSTYLITIGSQSRTPSIWLADHKGIRVRQQEISNKIQFWYLRTTQWNSSQLADQEARGKHIYLDCSPKLV